MKTLIHIIIPATIAKIASFCLHQIVGLVEHEALLKAVVMMFVSDEQYPIKYNFAYSSFVPLRL